MWGEKFKNVECKISHDGASPQKIPFGGVGKSKKYLLIIFQCVVDQIVQKSLFLHVPCNIFGLRG